MTDTTLQNQTVTKTATISLWNLILLNDDFTPIDFVMQVLIELCGKTDQEAYAITMDIHNTGRGVVSTYTEEIAKQKAHDITLIAAQNKHPLKAIAEEA